MLIPHIWKTQLYQITKTNSIFQTNNSNKMRRNIYNHYNKIKNLNELTKTLVDSQDGPESRDMSSNDRDQLVGIDINQHQLTSCRAYPQCSARLEHHGLDVELGYSGIWILFTDVGWTQQNVYFNFFLALRIIHGEYCIK